MKFVASVIALVACLSLIASESTVAQSAPAAAGGHQRVLIYPFTQISTPGKLDWLSHGIQEDIITELNSSRGMQAMAPAAGQDAAPADVAAAVDQGRKAGANYVVYGTFQASETELRIGGSVVDVNDPQQAVTKLKVTGPVTALFHLEDALDQQVESAVGLGPPAAAATAATNPPPNYQPAGNPPPSDQPQSYQPPPDSPSETYIGPYDSSGYYADQGPSYSSYPAYGYSYAPYYYGGYPFSFGFVYGGQGYYGGGHNHGYYGGGNHGGGNGWGNHGGGGGHNMGMGGGGHMGMGMGGGGGHMGGGGGGHH